jgi:predicted membrane-bound dolichyl-phosphate-mannose-protein mannosyltransferase
VSASASGPDLLRAELAEGTAHGEVYLRRLRRAQLALSVMALVAFGGLVGVLPLVLLMAPGLQRVTVAGVPLPVVLVVLVPYPLFFAIGWLQERRAAALEATFRRLVERGRE